MRAVRVTLVDVGAHGVTRPTCTVDVGAHGVTRPTCTGHAIMKALDDVGYTGWGIAEPAYSPPGVDTATRLKQVAEKLDRIFAS